MNANGQLLRIYRLFTVPLLCPVGLIALILAHVLLAVGEVVLALTHHDLAYMVLFTGDILALLLICVKAFRRMKRAKPKTITRVRKHRKSKAPRHRSHTAHSESPPSGFDEARTKNGRDGPKPTARTD